MIIEFPPYNIPQFKYWEPVYPPVTLPPPPLKNNSTFGPWETPWECPVCHAEQFPSEVETTEIAESGKDTRVEYHGKIRPTYIYDNDTSWVVYDCLVCGYSWDNLPEDPEPGGASVAFLHPVNETVPCCEEGSCHICIDRDAC